MTRENSDVEPSFIVKTLMYFDIFDYPINREEILKFAFEPIDKPNEIDGLLDRLVSQKLIFKHGEFYGMQDDPSLVERRLKGNAMAEGKIKLSYRISRLIYQFPFVRGVMLSGSISKGYMDEKSDIDYFIITAPERLWVARMLLVLFKRIFFFNSHKYFCVNYFIDTDHLEIEEKNRFTAIESVTLIPTVCTTLYTYFRQSNDWAKNYFPNFPSRDKSSIQNPKTGPIKYLLELCLNNRLGNALDRYFMKITLRRWNQKFKGSYSDEDFEVAFKTRRHTSKNHPKFYQKKVLEEFEGKVSEFELKQLAAQAT
ncbi:MAG: nucleotidyltransferase domain-containing protein [Bacteroidota bacterium]